MGQRLENAQRLYLEAIRDGDAAAAIARYAGDRYTQHSTPVRDGPEGFVEFFDDFLQRNPIRDIQILRAFEDGQYVFLHVLQDLNHGEFRYVTADIFDTDDNAKLIEPLGHHRRTQRQHRRRPHPDRRPDRGRRPRPPPTPTKRSSRASSKTSCAPATPTGSPSSSPSNLIQHSQRHGEGIEGWRALLDSDATPAEATRYTEVHRVIGSGNFVASTIECEPRRHRPRRHRPSSASRTARSSSTGTWAKRSNPRTPGSTAASSRST